MISESELIETLHRMAQDFREAVREKNYMRAKALQIKASIITDVMKLDRMTVEELFGYVEEVEDEVDVHPGLFPRHDVSRVDLECCIKRHKAYEDIACMKAGKEISYYSDEDYCARCKRQKNS